MDEAGGAHYPAFAGCYGCAPANPAGLRISGGGTGAARFTVCRAHQGAPGRAHGGVIAAALDEAIGITVWSLGGAYATARLEVDYLIPVPVGATLYLTAVCTGRQRRKVYARAEARLGGRGGPVAARASALYLAIPGPAANWSI